MRSRSRRADTSAADEATKLHTLFEGEWQWTLREYPEFATNVGDPRYNDKLTDLRAAAIDRRKAHEKDVLKAIRDIDRALLTGQDVLSYDLFRRESERSVALERFPAGVIPLGGFLTPYEWMPICQMDGVHIDIPELPRKVPLLTTKDFENFLARLAGYPRQIDQILELMKRGMAAGWVPPAVPIRKVLPQIEKQWVNDVTTSPLYKPFADFREGIPAAERPRLAARAREEIAGSIIPCAQEAASVYRRDVFARVPPGNCRIAAAERSHLLPGPDRVVDDDQPISQRDP